MSLYPRILVISHNCFSLKGSNGRTLANFLNNRPKESLAQFYINNEIPDSPVCDNYFRVTDIEALKAFTKGIKVGHRIGKINSGDAKDDKSQINLYNKHRKRTPFNYLTRNLIWNSGKWKSEAFEKWIKEFNPEAILLQVGDYSFMFKIALDIAKKQKIPIVLYNSEDYYFKDKKSYSILYQLFRYQYKKWFEKLISYASHTVYICDMLQQTYNNRFAHDSTVIMTATNIIANNNKIKNKQFITSYLGNLGIGRQISLCEIANALQSIDKNLKLDVYGRIPNADVEAVLNSCAGIDYKGFISYDEVVKVMQNSDLLVHTENFSDFTRWDLKHAFSTKIADSLASGTCFFVYAPEDIACVKYLQENGAACVETDRNRLQSTLKKLIDDDDLRQTYINNAKKVVKNRHDVYSNSGIFNEILLRTIEKF